MSRYLSDRPCPVHGAPVERYVIDNRCCPCHAQHQKNSRARRVQAAPSECPTCGSMNKDGRGQCKECNKPLFGRKVPSSKRLDMIAFLRAISLSYGVTTGDMRWGNVVFDGKHNQQIIWFIIGLQI